MAHEEIARKRK
jgi:hypothetical protein